MASRSPFNAGPRLTDVPSGDPATQAIASLRGYAYQLYSSSLAWLALGPGQELYLEVAKDYAVAAQGALEAYEVKNTGKKVSINSESIRETLDSFIDLVERNPARQVHLSFLSTSHIAKERSKEHRPEGEAALHYWRRSAAGADVTPLRHVLSRIELSTRVRGFIDARNDQALREEFLRRIHWDCGRPGLDSVTAELHTGLMRYGADRLRVPSSENDRLTAAVVHHVLTVIVGRQPRRLTDTDLLAVVDKASQVTLSRFDFDALMRRTGSQLVPDQEPTTLEAASFLVPEQEIPLPKILAERSAVITSILQRARSDQVAVITGSTGSGKTILARLAGRNQGGSWHLLDLRNASPTETAQRLNFALGSLRHSDPTGIILDDLNEIEESGPRRALSRLLSGLKRRDALCLITAYRPPSARVYSDLGIDRAVNFSVPDLTVEEVNSMITAAGGDGRMWAAAVRIASAFGHPQLVQAIISGLRERSWPTDELRGLRALDRSPDAEAERFVTRQRLVATIPDEARTLLYRVSLIIGRFSRQLALALGALRPPIHRPGEQIDILVGPWIEQVGRDHLRISPLLQNSGKEILANEEQRLVHQTAAEQIVSGRKINVGEADSAFLHALLGQSEITLLKLAYGVLQADALIRGQLSEWMTGLRLHRLDRPIYAAKPTLSLTLRFAQFLLVGESRNVAAIRKCWSVLQKELTRESDQEVREHFEYMILAKFMIDRATAGALPNWIDLILRFEALSNTDSERRETLENMKQPIEGQPVRTPLGMFFVLQMMGIRSVGDLKVAFDRLDELTPAQRQTFFADAINMASDFALVVNSAWLAEQKRGNADWGVCAESYRHMAIQARAWGYDTLAMRCHVARGIILDEYARDSESAKHALEDAKTIFGDDPILIRAEAKLLFRHKDHGGALQLLRNVADKIALSDPVERTYLLREGGICAAEIAEWAEARHWFAAAREASSAAHPPRMNAMAIGLRADEAIAAFKEGDAAAAIIGFGITLDELNVLDANSSAAAGYCHRVIRHAILWLYGSASQKDIVVDGQPPAMMPGMCSNPEPTDVGDLPLSSLHAVRYLLAQTEVAAGVNAGIESGLRAHLGNRAIPQMEILLRSEQLTYDIHRLEVDRFFSHLPAWSKMRLYVESHAASLLGLDSENPVYDEIEPVSSAQLQSPAVVTFMEDALLAFGTMAAFRGRLDVLTSLGTRASLDCGEFSGDELRTIMATGASASDRFNDNVALHIHKVASHTAMTPDELFVAGVRFVQSVHRSSFKSVLTPALLDWSRERWTYIVREQRFYLRNLAATIPAIQEALASSEVGLSFVGKLLVAIEPAVRTRCDQSIRRFLLSV